MLNLWRWGGFKVTSILAWASASMIRAAHRTVSFREETLRFMFAAVASETEPLQFASVWLGRPWADWWGTHPVAHWLSIALAGFCHFENKETRWHVHHRLSSCVSRIVREVQVEESQFLASHSAHKKLKFHRALFTRLLAELYPDDIALTIRKRINKYRPEAALRLIDAMLQELKDLSFSLPAAFAQQLLRTFSNGWTTSWRTSEASALDCIFGCAGEQDDLCHYLFCPVLWSAIWKLMVPPLLKTHFEF